MLNRLTAEFVYLLFTIHLKWIIKSFKHFPHPFTRNLNPFNILKEPVNGSSINLKKGFGQNV